MHCKSEQLVLPLVQLLFFLGERKMKRSYLFFLLGLFLALPQPAQAQFFWFDSSKNIVIGCSLVTAGVFGLGTYLLARDKHDYNHQKKEKGLFAAAIGLVGGLLGGCISYQVTPDSSLRAGHNTRDSLEKNSDFQKIINAHSLKEIGRASCRERV